MSIILLTVGAFVVYQIVAAYLSLQANIRIAKKTELPYIVSPVSPYWRLWQIVHKPLIPLIKSLPKSWWEEWLDPVTPRFMFNTRNDWFEKVGTCVMVVSPYRTLIFVANAEAIRQITLKREQFPKQTEVYSTLKRFGDNVVTTEGAEWRMHRKVTAPSFNEKNTAIIFKEAIYQAQSMVYGWTGPSGNSSGRIDKVQHDTMRLALHVISYVGFGLRLLWPGQSFAPGTHPNLTKYGSVQPADGYRLSFGDTMESLMNYLLLLVIVPLWLLRLLPMSKPKQAILAFEEYTKYMDDLLNEKIADVRKGDHSEEGMDLMGQLVESSYGKKAEKAGAVLSRQDIIGNAFIMFLAGHETTASTIHFTLINLAAKPSTQRRLQQEIDAIVGKKDPKDWEYEALINPLTASMVGACMNETLRLMPPASELPKRVSPVADQTIVMDGKPYWFPKGTGMILIPTAPQANARYWPTEPSKIRPGKSDMYDWVPERWFKTLAKSGTQDEDEVAGADSEDFGGFQGSDVNADLFRPERGAYIPFSDGARSCLGRRIALVEVVAAIAVIMQNYSVELAVDDWATLEEVDKMSKEEKIAVYKKAQRKSRETLDGAYIIVTLKLQDGNDVPLRLVRRGEEKFTSWIE